MGGGVGGLDSLNDTFSGGGFAHGEEYYLGPLEVGPSPRKAFLAGANFSLQEGGGGIVVGG